MHHHPSSSLGITWRALFIGQFLIWASCSFFAGMAIHHLQQTTSPTQPHHDHHHDTEPVSWTPTQREPTPALPDMVDQDLSALVEQVRTGNTHNAAALSEREAKQKYAELCTVYASSCLNTLREGAYSRSDKYLYQWFSIALMKHIDTRLRTPKKLATTFSQLKIYQDDQAGRWSAGYTTIKINTQKIPTTREFREVLAHEFWHIIDLSLLTGNNRTLDRSFTEFDKVIRPTDDLSLPFYQISRLSESTRKRAASYKDFVSGYAMKNIYEDFAESQNLRFNHNLLFQELANHNDVVKQKYLFFKNLYTNQRFDDNPDSVALVNLDERPWDSTKIQ